MESATNSSNHITLGEEKPATDPYDQRLDQELHVVRNLRVSMESLLKVFEIARDDLVVLGDKMDQVRVASERCRKELMKRNSHSETVDESESPKKPTKRKQEGECLIGKTRRTS